MISLKPGDPVHCTNRYTEESFRATVYAVLKRERALLVRRGSAETVHVTERLWEVRRYV